MINLKHMGLELKDLQPAESQFELTAKPGQKFTLAPFSIGVQMWAEEALGEDYMKKVFNPALQGPRVKLAWKLLKEKAVFENKFEKFCEAFTDYVDQSQIFTAVTTSIGVSQPVIEKVQKRVEEMQANGEALPNELTPQAQ